MRLLLYKILTHSQPNIGWSSYIFLLTWNAELTDAIQLPLKNPTPKQLLRTDVIEAFYVFDSSVPHKFRNIPCKLFTSSNIKIYRLPASFPALQFHTTSNQNQLYQWQEKSENQAPQRCQPQAISTVKHVRLFIITSGPYIFSF